VKRFDALVVGAGPAGSMTAYHLASAGASVLLVDKAKFPRDKPCGGGVTIRAAKELPFSIDPVVEDVVDTFELRFRYGWSFARGGRGTLCLLTQRRRLDEFLAQQAAEAGAEFRQEARVEFRDAVPHVDGIRVEGDVIVAGDGVNGATPRAFGLAREYGHGVALEGNVPCSRIDCVRYGGRLVLELGTVPGGYGWVFPKGDHVNIGVGGWESEGPRLREHLRRLCDAHGANADELEDLRGYRLPYRRAESQLAKDNVLLVGDAAGLVDPLSGDGIYEAFVSARLAADAILAGELDAYASRVLARLTPLHTAGWVAKRAVDRFPRLAFALAWLPFAWPSVARIVRGELRDPRDERGLGRMPLKALNALGRAA
jgi:geranylgeranyl reductase family protein